MRHTPYQVLIDLGFPTDLGIYGKEVLCFAIISQENQQWEKCLIAEFEIASQMKRAEGAELQEKKRKDGTKAKTDQKRDED